MNKQLVWITGRAAAGKSTLMAHLVNTLAVNATPPSVYVDEEILLELVRDDADHVHHWHPHHDHRIAFRTGHLFDECLRVLNARLLDHLSRPGLALIELARGRHAPPIDVTYRKAAEILDSRLWASSLVFRLDVEYAEQVHRNTGRTTGTGSGTPAEIMRTLYGEDDPATFVRLGIPVHTLPASDPPVVNAERVLAKLASTTTCGTRRVAAPLHDEVI